MNRKLVRCNTCNNKIYFKRLSKKYDYKFSPKNPDGSTHNCSIKFKHNSKKKKYIAKRSPNKFAAKRHKLKEVEFYKSSEWVKLRLKVFLIYDKQCMFCKTSEKLQVDHIKPRSLYPLQELDLDNLQILCETCNKWKGSRYDFDFRTDDDIQCLVDFRLGLQEYIIKRREERGIYGPC